MKMQRQLTNQSQEDKQSASMTNSFYDPNNVTSGQITGGERVKVAMRLRPMMPHEL